jgi:uncharacterized protein (DUF427 family)
MRIQRIEPGPGQESVWDYPRPPIAVGTDSLVRIVHRGVEIARTTSAVRVLETSQAPGFYLPRADIRMDLLHPSDNATLCEWKGRATYWTLRVDGLDVADVAWSYERPTRRFASIAGHLAFYPQRMDECWVDDEQVLANDGSFYGGWITSRVVGPFKGARGTLGW